MINDFAIVVSSCDAFSDLWDQHFSHLFKNWSGDLPSIYLVTDKPTTFSTFGVNIMVFDGEMPLRIKKACELIKEKYILLTLDDYFLVKPTHEDFFSFFIGKMINSNIDYLSIYDRWKTKRYKEEKISQINRVDLDKKYAVTLYPAIWNKVFFEKCVSQNDDPWHFEPRLTKNAKLLNANCFYNTSGVFIILDVVRKGCVLRKANRYFKKNGISIGNRQIIKRRTELFLWSQDFVQHHFPRTISRFVKKIAKLFGKRFYSDD